MMYLVLMAMLAMNVSKEVLDSFILINDALENTNSGFKSKINDSYGEIQKQQALQGGKADVEAALKKAKEVKTISESTMAYIDELKKRVIANTMGYDAEFGEDFISAMSEANADSLWDIKNFKSKDNYDAPTAFLLGGDPALLKEGEWTATELRGKLEEFKTKLEAVTGGKVQTGIEFKEVKQPDGQMQSWENGNFYHIPIAAVVTNITRLEADVLNAEASVMNYLLGTIGKNDFKFDKIGVKVIPSSRYVVVGDSFKADVIVAAYNSSSNPVLEVGSAVDSAKNEVVNPVDPSRIKVQDGLASYGYKVTSEGEVKWGGYIRVKKPNSEEYESYKFEDSFIAAKPSATISPSAMNVFYRGLENPLEISVAGFSADKIQVNVTNGSKSGDKGVYKIKPGNGKECVITVSVKRDNGKVQRMAEQKFRVKSVPKPEPMFAGLSEDGNVSKGQLLAADRVFANLKDFVFDGVKFKVVSFEMGAYNKGKYITLKSSSAGVTGAMKNLLRNQKRNSRVFLSKITAVGPSGKRKVLSGLQLKVK